MDIISKTLPIQLDNGIHLEKEDAQEYGRSLNEKYLTSEPYPHIVIDDFLPANIIDLVGDNFPVGTTNIEQHFEKGYTGLHKRQISPYACDPRILNLFHFFNSAPMLQFLEELTSIRGLIPDTYFSGGGLHETYTGGLLGIHSDFRIKEGVHLLRRLNIIIYLNEDWTTEYGGCLELWDPDMTNCVSSIAPIKNRCVIFNTDEHSNHGHPKPLNTPLGISRKSMALYYYTASEHVYDEVGFSRTLYKARPDDSAKVKRVTKRRERRDKRKIVKAKVSKFLKKLFRS
jgi:hypothetical protein